MTVADEKDVNTIFSPRELSPEHLVVAFLMHRISTLTKPAVQDLVSLIPELEQCGSAEAFREIAETMREILFPELLGQIKPAEEISKDEGDVLQKRMTWIGERIKDCRTKAGLTQIELAERSGLPQSHISRLEAGQHSPSQRTLERIANALGINVTEIDEWL